MTMPNPSDLRQSLLAFFMILFFGSTMSLVWTFTVIVPFIKGTNYGNGSCSLAGINGVPPVCRNHTYFNKINLFSNNGVSWLRLHITFAYISTVPIFIFRLNWALTGPLTPCFGIKNNNYSGIGVKRLYLSRKLRPVTVMSLSKLCLIAFFISEMVQRRWILWRNDFTIGLHSILCQIGRQVFYTSWRRDRYYRHVSRSNPLFRHHFKFISTKVKIRYLRYVLPFWSNCWL